MGYQSMIKRLKSVRISRYAALPLGALIALSMVGASTPAPTANSVAADPAVWIGSPIEGRWTDSQGCKGAKFPSSSCSLPTVHHNYFVGGNSWATDLQVGKGASVKIYGAPSNTALNNRIAAKIESIAPACRSKRLADGGSRILVGFYLDKKTLIGKVAYAHVVAKTGLKQGAWVNRWSTLIGTVGSYSKGSCWTGVHHHLELGSRQGYACFNKGYVASSTPSKSSKLFRSNFVGFIGGSYAGPRKPCP